MKEAQQGKRIFDSLSDALCNVRSWGLAFNRAWVYLMFLGIGASLLSVEGTPIPASVYLASTIGLCSALLCGVVLRRFMESWLMKPQARWTAVCLTAAGTLFALLLPQSLPVVLLAVLGGLTTGVGSGLLDLCYGEVYRNVAPEEARIETPLAALLAAVIYSLVFHAEPVIAILLTSALPLFSGLVLMVQKGVWVHSGTRSLVDAPAPSKRLILRVGLCACGVGIADGVNRQLFFMVSGISVSDFYGSGMVISAIFTAVVLVGFAVLVKEKVSGLYKAVCFLVVGSIILTPSFFPTELSTTGAIIILVGYNTFNVFIWVLLSDLTYNLRISATATFGVGWGMLTVGHLVGQMLASSMASTVLTSELTMMTSAFCGLLALAACLFVLQDDDFAEVADMKTVVATVAEQVEQSIAEEPAEDAVATPESPAEEKRGPGRFQSKCLELAQASGLTPRETEILILFARGRTAARIQEELYLSKGTVLTHLQHIYQKTGVHSKQELLDLLN